LAAQPLDVAAIIKDAALESELLMTNAAVFADPAHGVIDNRVRLAIQPSADDMAAGTSQDLSRPDSDELVHDRASLQRNGQQHADYVGVAVDARGWIVVDILSL
jgi:hypothetical protein